MAKKDKKPMKAKTVRRVITFSEAEWNALREAAAGKASNATAVVREAVRKHLGIK